MIWHILKVGIRYLQGVEKIEVINFCTFPTHQDMKRRSTKYVSGNASFPSYRLINGVGRIDRRL